MRVWNKVPWSWLGRWIARLLELRDIIGWRKFQWQRLGWLKLKILEPKDVKTPLFEGRVLCLPNKISVVFFAKTTGKQWSEKISREVDRELMERTSWISEFELRFPQRKVTEVRQLNEYVVITTNGVRGNVGPIEEFLNDLLTAYPKLRQAHQRRFWRRICTITRLLSWQQNLKEIKLNILCEICETKKTTHLCVAIT